MARPPKTDDERARDRRSWMIAGGLFAFVILVFVITIVRMKDGAAVGPHF